ncbi:MAG: AAA family ATPase, partial [candidate division NC10 bacterium]|nr:AAA family ATPase [candidate division NC10 bacterium]
MHAVTTMKGLAVVVGDLGTGKTMLARRMLDALDEGQVESALLVIIHSAITPEWLLRKIALQLGVEGVPENADKVSLLTLLYQRLAELQAQRKKAVVLIDEANMLQRREVMEEFRGLLNLEVPEGKLITFIFFGLPELEEHLAVDPPLAQRVALKCRMKSFTPEATRAYIAHRLRVAGATRELFTPEALEAVHRHARGVPRLINTLCDNALLEGFLLKRDRIDAEGVHGVARALG